MPVVAPPIRILLVSARPEDEACGYIDHRASALPLVEAMESLPGLVTLHVLSPPTLPALRGELERARAERKPYHVVHFDGHGVYDRRVGLGGLCFELPKDAGRLAQRRHVTVFTNELGPLLRDHRIPLVFLEACQSAQAEQASESVASELLKVGVASVVAMSHSVLVETARRFVAAFYRALAAGKRVGDAMLAGQRRLKDDTFRGRIFGAGELRLEDWFVPVLFQEKDDPQLFKTTPARQTLADFQTALKCRLGELPPQPETGFIGRSRELLALQRLLFPSPRAEEEPGERKRRYAVVRGQGGEGKTALAAEFARWMVRSQQMHRAVFVSVETHSHVAAVLDALGRQLVGKGYSVAAFDDLEKAILPVERALMEQATLLVDNMESILLPPFLADETPAALSEDARRELDAILKLCARLNAQGDTRLVFTSREALPAPFDAQRQRRELHQLDREDAVKLVERALNAAGGDAGASSDAATEEIEQLVDAVHCHARTLALLAPALRSRGVAATRASLVELMAQMDKEFPVGHPNAREKSVFASVELSLRRMSDANRERARVLGVFHGGVHPAVLCPMMQWEMEDFASLARELVEVGLATDNSYSQLNLNPALCPYLRGRMNSDERETLTLCWIEATRTYVAFLEQQRHRNTELTAALTILELPNLFALLDHVQCAEDAAATIALTTSLYILLQGAGKPRLLGRVAQVRDAAAAALGEDWTDARFEAKQTRIEQQLADGRLREALDGARVLLDHAQAAGEQAYPRADYHLAYACFLLGRVLREAGGAKQALPLLEEGRWRFESIAKERSNQAAEGMASACLGDQGQCFIDLGQLDAAGAAYEEGINRDERRGAIRDIAVGKAQLGTVRLHQRRYPEALAAFVDARELFARFREPGSVAGMWHQTGLVYQGAGHPEAAEDAYRESLAITVRLGDVPEQARTLGALGWLYSDVFNRQAEAVAFFRQAAEKYVLVGDIAREGAARNNLSVALRKFGQFDDARKEIKAAIDRIARLSRGSSLCAAWANLADIETDAGNRAAATQARSKAIECFLAYRRDSGENHGSDGRICFHIAQHLRAGDAAAAAVLLQQEAAVPDLPDRVRHFFQALQAIVSGSRDRRLADAPDLHYTMAAEILFLIETLEKAA